MDITLLREFAQFGLAGLLVCFLTWWLTHTFTAKVDQLRIQIERTNMLLVVLTVALSKGGHHIEAGELNAALTSPVDRSQ